jgi:hypothetical protein
VPDLIKTQDSDDLIVEAIVTREENFRQWEDNELMSKYVSIIQTFVMNGVLESSPETFLGTFNRYEAWCEKFHKDLEDVWEAYSGRIPGGMIVGRWDINFQKRVFHLKLSKEVFDLREFSLDSLKVKASDMSKILMCLNY